jgi:hypothetical protein
LFIDNKCANVSINEKSLPIIILKHSVCPFGIIRGILISGVAFLFLQPFRANIFTGSSRFEVLLFLAGFMDMFSRSAGFIWTLSEDKSEGVMARLKQIVLQAARSLFLSDHGGQLLFPVWIDCIVVYFFFL